MFKYIVGLLILFTVLMTTNSCDRFKDSRIQGHWKMISGTNVNTRNRNIFFRFEKGRVAISQGPLNAIADTCSYGRYYVDAGMLEIAAPLTFCYGTTYHGDWTIVTFKKDYLVITQDNELGLRTYEFIKEEEDKK
jgi:hypothetical protein